MREEIPPAISSDQRWYWDGVAWLPTPVPLAKWRWDGDGWVRKSWWKDLPRGLKSGGFAWLLCLIVWIPIAETVGGRHFSHARMAATIAFAALAVVATVVFGGWLGFKRYWRYVSRSYLVGIGLVSGVIFFAFENAVPPNAPDDPGVGLGALVAAVAVSPVIGLLLWSGGGIGALVRRTLGRS
jgi:hypothetical protein